MKKNMAQFYESHLPPLAKAGSQPFSLINSKMGTEDWGPSACGALMSTMASKQWPQSRLHRAALAQSANCRLCVAMGLCDPHDPNPLFKGMLLHRMWLCKVTEDLRCKLVPRWLRAEVASELAGGVSMQPSQEIRAHLVTYTNSH